MNKPHESRNSEPNKQSPRNIFENFSCSWALENFSQSRGLRTDISQKTVVGCPWIVWNIFRINHLPSGWISVSFYFMLCHPKNMPEKKKKVLCRFILKISLKYFSTNCLCTKTLLYSGDIFCSLIIAVIDWIVPINSTFRDVYDLSGKRMEEMAYFSKNELC